MRSASREQQAGRILASLLDQAIYSANTIAMVALTTRTLSQQPAARFATATIAVLVSIVLSRSLVGTFHLVRGSGASGPATRAKLERDALSGSLLLAVACASITLLVLVSSGLVDGASTAGLAIGAVAVVLHDALRHFAMARLRFALAASSSVLWFAVTLIGGAFATDVLEPVHWWAVGGFVASIALITQLRTPISVTIPRSVDYFRETFPRTKIILQEQTIGALAGFLVLILVAWWTRAEDVGFVRIAQTAVGPIGVAAQGAIPFLTTRFAATGATDRQTGLALRIGGAMIAIGLLGLIPFALFAPSIGLRAFGPVWDQSFGFGIALWLAACVMAGRVGLVALLRAIDALETLRSLRLRESIVITGSAIALSLIFGIDGYVAGVLGGSILSSGFWLHHVLTELRDQDPSRK